MRIVAALAWYREPPEFLARCVGSLAHVVDAVVALDGPWQHFPDQRPHSTIEEGLAIIDAAHRVGLRSEIRTQAEPFESQVVKRAELMELAAEFGDWILVIDGDEFVTYSDACAVREGLAATDAVCASIGLTNLSHRRELGGGLRRRLYRAGTTVEIVHTGYTFEGRQLLRGEPTLDLAEHLHIEHDYANRDEERNQWAREYVAARSRESVEVWV